MTQNAAARAVARPAARLQKLKGILPGVLLAFTVAAAARFLSEHYGGPVMLFALLIGMAFHFLSQEGPCVQGIEFASKSLLRLGVALLGARVTLEEISALGITPIVVVVICVGATISAGLLFARLAGKHWSVGMLTGGAVAICGASAALAISSVLPHRADRERDTLFTVVAVTGLSTLAMIVYPLLFSLLGLPDAGIGILIGATIHDVAQVVGAGYAVSPEAGDVATYVKLLRVALLPLVVLGLAFMAIRGTSSGEGMGRAVSSFPWFAVAFLIILVVNSAGAIPESVRAGMSLASRWLLVAAIAALGVKTSIQAMLRLGPGYLVIVVAETLFLAALAVGLYALSTG